MALVITAVLAVVSAVVILIAYYTDPPIAPRRKAVAWDVLPDPADVARTEFPLHMPGYHPATVEEHYELLGRAYADLLAAAPPEAIAQARQRAALRLGVDLDADLEAQGQSGTPGVAAWAAVPVAQEASDAQALRAEAALADLDAQSGDTTT
jgi:hypothetical protein